jgi:hypothetical protein
MATDPQRIPVIVGVGQVNDRPEDPMQGLDSVGLMAAAIRRADEDAGGGWLERCDWLANVQQVSFPGMDVVGLLPEQLGITPKTRIEKPPYGDAPIQLISDAANAVAAGEATVCIACGGEALRTAAKRPQDGGAKLFGNAAAVSTDVQRRYGLTSTRFTRTPLAPPGASRSTRRAPNRAGSGRRCRKWRLRQKAHGSRNRARRTISLRPAPRTVRCRFPIPSCKSRIHR